MNMSECLRLRPPSGGRHNVEEYENNNKSLHEPGRGGEAGPQVNVWPPWTLILMNHWGRFLSLSAVSRPRRGGGEKFGKFIDFEIIIINNIFFYVLGKFVEIHLQNCWKSIKTVGVSPMSEWGEVKLKWVSFWECSGLQQEFNKIW